MQSSLFIATYLAAFIISEYTKQCVLCSRTQIGASGSAIPNLVYISTNKGTPADCDPQKVWFGILFISLLEENLSTKSTAAVIIGSRLIRLPDLYLNSIWLDDLLPSIDDTHTHNARSCIPSPGANVQTTFP